MRLPEFCLKHPVFAAVLNVMIIIIGWLSFDNLTLREYPKVEIPALGVSTNYPNASPELVESAVTNILEDKLAAVEGLESMVSFSGKGNSHIGLTFKEGHSVDQAVIAVRDAVSMAQLPDTVKAPDIRRQQESSGMPFIGISLSSSTLNFEELTHFANINITNAFRSITGVASASVWGQPYTMSVELDPKKLYAFGINPDDVYNAIKSNNISWPVGSFQNNIPTSLDMTLETVDEFENLLLKEVKGKSILLKHVATINERGDNKQYRVRINGHPGMIIGVDRTSESNPLEVSKAVRAQLEEVKKYLPGDVDVKMSLDQSQAIRASLKNIRFSILEAAILVLIVVFLFLRNIRATIIPLLTIPISLIGSFALLKLFGFSVNTITLLAMVLAIGLVVDDAIVVLENIARHIENGMKPLEAALKGSREIGFAIVAMTLTLASVYAPIAFIEGAIGQLFVEFAVTLAGSVIISGLVALTLSPLLCSLILKAEPSHILPKIEIWLSQLTTLYEKTLLKVMSHTKYVFGAAGGLAALAVLMFWLLPQETAPKEDRGLFSAYISTIPGKDTDAIDAVAKKIEDMTNYPEAQEQFTFMGHWGGIVIWQLKEPEDRKRKPVELVEDLREKVKTIPSVAIWPESWDSGLPGMNISPGSELSLEIQTVKSYKDLWEFANKLRKIVEDSGKFASVNQNLSLDTPGYSIHMDDIALAQSELTAEKIAKAVAIYFSEDQSLQYEHDHIRYAVTLKSTLSPWTLDEIYLTNPKGKRISVGALARLDQIALPKRLDHYNQMRSTSLSVSLKPGQRMGDAMATLYKMAKKNLEPGFKLTWSGAAKMYVKSSFAMLLLLGMALVFIYAILAVQFESFIDPLIIMITVPLACAGALLVLWICGQSINIYTQIGLVTLIGLITKHGILIVEFANQCRLEGLSITDSIIKSTSLRLRPILMTTGAMIFGTIPLALSMGTGAESRRAIGIVLLGGLTFGTVLTLFILPTFYTFVKQFMDRQTRLG